MGFTEWTTYKDIKEKAFNLGLDLCPPVLALEIRNQYTGYNWVTVAMNPIEVRDGDLRLFDCNGGNGKSWLGNNSGHDDDRWDSDSRFFFVRKSNLKTKSLNSNPLDPYLLELEKRLAEVEARLDKYNLN